MTSGYYCAIFPFCGGGKKKDDKKTKAFYDWATTGIPVKKDKKTKAFYDWATTGIPVKRRQKKQGRFMTGLPQVSQKKGL